MADDTHSTPQEEMRSLYEALTELRERLNELKRQTAKGDIENYTLTNHAGEKVSLASLFGDKKDLIVIQNMGKSCPYCTLWADGFTGSMKHLENRAAVVMVTPDSPEEQKIFADGRDWNFTMLSSQDSMFKKDLGFESESGDQMPGVSTFRLDGEQVVNVANDYFGPGDDYCSVWHLFDLLDGGPDGWAPKYTY